ncbi:cation:dicarboxylate symporter family transporter [Chryseobacterium sp. GP-SGM7]|uniref:cation:dicarboxylate symporter family transporter n=1 Tax=Chryseobacterium sp. GP-SGM7 TaxID=3411323 RepID=UPI003B9379EE
MTVSEDKKTFTNAYLRNLTLYIFVSIIAGVLVGNYFPQTGLQLGHVSQYFFSIIEILIFPVIFGAIIYGICSISDIKNSNRIVLQTILYFLIITSICIILGFAFALVLKPGSSTGIEISKVSKLPSHFKVEEHSWTSDLLFNKHGILLVLSIVTGVFMNLSPKRLVFLKTINTGINFFYKAIKYIYILLPVIIFCNISFGISMYGINTLLPLSKIVATVYLADLVFIFGILGSLCHFFKINLWDFLIKIKEEILLVITTSASKTSFPMIFDKMESQGYDKKLLTFIIPLGYTFNLAGACIYISVSTVFLIQFYNIHLETYDYIWLFIIISLTSKTASGVPGSGFLALIFTLNRFGKIPLTDLALLYSVDRFMNEARAVTNFIGISVSGAIISKMNQNLE